VKRPASAGLFFAEYWKIMGLFVEFADIYSGFYWNFHEKTALFQL